MQIMENSKYLASKTTKKLAWIKVLGDQDESSLPDTFPITWSHFTF